MHVSVRRIVFAGLLSLSAPAWAGPVLLLTATSVEPGKYSGFTVTFDDADMDSQLDFAELTTFSGFTDFAGSGLYPTLGKVAETAFSDLSGGAGCLGNPEWCFLKPGSIYTAGPSAFTYAITPVGTAVPEPATLGLVAAALAAAALTRRKRHVRTA
jgi:hypothetical protein